MVSGRIREEAGLRSSCRSAAEVLAPRWLGRRLDGLQVQAGGEGQQPPMARATGQRSACNPSTRSIVARWASSAASR